MFYALATNNEFVSSRVSAFVACSPVLRIANTKSPSLYFMAWNLRIIYNSFLTIKDYEVFEETWLTSNTVGLACRVVPQLCSYGVFLMSDEQLGVEDKHAQKLYMGHYPAGASLRDLDYFM